MEKIYVINMLGKAFLVLALVSSCTLSAQQAPAKNMSDDPTKVIQPTSTLATILVSTLNPSVTPSSTIPVYLNKKVDNGKFVSGGTILANKICPWKIGQVPNSNTGAYAPLQAGTRPTALSTDNYYQDPTGTTAFCGNVSVAGDVTVTGTLANNTGQFCLTSNVAINPSNSLLINNISPVRTVGGACVADDRACAVTSLTGAADIDGRRFGTISNVTLTETPLAVLGLEFDSNIYDCPTSIPVAVKIHFIGYGNDNYDDCFSVCFSEEVVVSPDPYSGGSSICVLSDPVTCISGTH